MVMQIQLVVVVVVDEFSYLRINCLRKGGNLDSKVRLFGPYLNSVCLLIKLKGL